MKKNVQLAAVQPAQAPLTFDAFLKQAMVHQHQGFYPFTMHLKGEPGSYVLTVKTSRESDGDRWEDVMEYHEDSFEPWSGERLLRDVEEARVAHELRENQGKMLEQMVVEMPQALYEALEAYGFNLGAYRFVNARRNAGRK